MKLHLLPRQVFTRWTPTFIRPAAAFLALLLLHLPPLTLRAQIKCSDSDILTIKGSWKQDADANMRPSPDYDHILTNLDSISLLFRAAYPEPKGMEAVWYRSMRNSDLPGLAGYTLNSGYFSWYCNQNLHRVLLGEETATWAYVYVNSLAPFLTDRYDNLRLKNGASLYALPRRAGTWKGYELYQPPGFSYGKCLVLTRAGRVLWRPVSQQEFLQSLVAYVDGCIQAAGTSFAAKFYNTEKGKINDYLNRTDAITLSKPALLPFSREPAFDGSFWSEDRGGRNIVTIDPGYFDAHLPAYRPQVMMLEWRCGNDGPSQQFKQAFEANFPVDRLQVMLDGHK